MDKDIKAVLTLLENIGAPGATSILTGASMAQDEMECVGQEFATDNIGYGSDTEPEQTEFSDLEFKLAKRFLELIGGAERARDLIDKCDECQECLGLVSDEDQIETISGMIPSDVDLPTMQSKDLSPLYNPGAISGPYSSY